MHFHSSSDWAAASSATAVGDKNQFLGTVPIRVIRKNEKMCTGTLMFFYVPVGTGIS
jgi:hypothetical protein